MNDFEIMPDDPRLTAYALGELEGDERASVEAAVRANPGLRAAVDEIRATMVHLEAALAAEAAADDAGRVVSLETIVAGAKSAQSVAPRARKGGKLIQFPQLYYVVGGLAAACVALFVAVNREDYAAREEAHRVAQQKAIEQQVAARAALTQVKIAAQAAPVETAPQATEIAAVAAPVTSGTAATVASAPVAMPAPVPVAAEPAEAVQIATIEPAAGALATGPAVIEPGEATKAGTGLSLLEQAQAVAASEAKPRQDAPAEPRFTATGPVDLFPTTARTFAAPITGAEPLPATAYSATPAANSEIVRLSAFEVSAQRDRAFAASLANVRRRVASAEMEIERHNNLPRPPSGARFGRNEEELTVVRDNAFQRALFHPVSTFSADVDTVSYAALRKSLGRRELPVRDGVRIEELLNYFPYSYPAPKAARNLSFLEKLSGEDGAPPFAAALEVAEAPWAPQHRLVRVGLRARDVTTTERAPANLVFLVDVSNSMNEPNKLPLVKDALRLLVGKLRADDRVAVVTYAGNSGVALSSTPVSKTREILAAIEGLTPSGIANGATGIRDAYAIAQSAFRPDGINRVILCTDGDFAVGPASETTLLELVDEHARRGLYLTVLGFGMGNYRDASLERIAHHGQGSFGYVDSRREAQKLLVEQVSSALVTIARDVKIQVEFNPLKVSSYRLIGYENRMLRREDFDTDAVDAGEIGAGHTLTALFEVVPVGAEKAVEGDPSRAGDLKYVRYLADDAYSSRLAMPSSGDDPMSRELLTVKVRYKKPEASIGLPRLQEFALTDRGGTFNQASSDFRFAAAVAQFGMILRNSNHRGTATMSDVISWASAAAASPSDDPGGYRSEFIELARQAAGILRGE